MNQEKPQITVKTILKAYIIIAVIAASFVGAILVKNHFYPKLELQVYSESEKFSPKANTLGFAFVPLNQDIELKIRIVNFDNRNLTIKFDDYLCSLSIKANRNNINYTYNLRTSAFDGLHTITIGAHDFYDEFALISTPPMPGGFYFEVTTAPLYIVETGVTMTLSNGGCEIFTPEI